MATAGANNVPAKLVLLGDMGTGKTSLVLRFIRGQFNEYQESTIGAAFFSQTIALNEIIVKLEIWDTAGQERYHSLAPVYYRGATVAIIVYDITSSDSFARAKKWVQELGRQGNYISYVDFAKGITLFFFKWGNPNLVMALAGNKADLVVKRKVEAEEAQQYAQENGLFFIETSAKTAQNVNELFYEIAKRVHKAQRVQHPTGLLVPDGPSDRPNRFCCVRITLEKNKEEDNFNIREVGFINQEVGFCKGVQL